MNIDINCDMGEGLYAIDQAMAAFISSGNIACGGHYGNAETIDRTVQLCRKYNVAVGAHPSYPDAASFGRKTMHLSMEELLASIKCQIDLCKRICEANKYPLHHIKLHGALYNDVAQDENTSHQLAQFFNEYYPGIIIYGLSGSIFNRTMRLQGIKVANEVFADRAYTDIGTLVPRTIPGAVLIDGEQILKQCMQLITANEVTTIIGNKISIAVDTLCFHSDTEGNVAHSALVYETLQIKKIGVRSIINSD